MLTNEFRRMSLALLLVASLGYGCSGKIAGGGSSGGGSTNGSGGSSSTTGSGGGNGNVDAGGVTVKPTTFTPALAGPTCRKIKDLLVGMPCSDADVNTVVTMGPAGLQQLIITWMTDPTFQPQFQGKMIPFFRNLFQQVGFTPTDDFKPQLLENGGFDFGPLGTGAVGDDVYFKLVKNLQDSFAMTAWQMVKEGTEPFSDVLSTQKFMMTTGLMSLYTQIEMPDDEPYNFSGGANTTTKLQWKLDYVNTIPLEDSLNPSSPNYMTFDDSKPTSSSGFLLQPTCQGVGDMVGTPKTVVTFGGASSGGFSNPTGGYAQLFQRLIGYTPRYPFLGRPDCWEHPSKPYMTDGDVSDWRWVTIMPKASGDAYIQPYNLPALRADEHDQAGDAAGRLLHDPRLSRPLEHQRQQPAPRDDEPDVARGARAVVHQRQQPHAAQRGRPRLLAHDELGRVLRLPQEPRPDADVLRQPVRLQRPQRLRGEPVQRLAAEPAPGGAAAGGVRLRRRELGQRPRAVRPSPIWGRSSCR